MGYILAGSDLIARVAQDTNSIFGGKGDRGANKNTVDNNKFTQI